MNQKIHKLALFLCCHSVLLLGCVNSETVDVIVVLCVNLDSRNECYYLEQCLNGSSSAFCFVTGEKMIVSLLCHIRTRCTYTHKGSSIGFVAIEVNMTYWVNTVDNSLRCLVYFVLEPILWRNCCLKRPQLTDDTLINWDFCIFYDLHWRSTPTTN